MSTFPFPGEGAIWAPPPEAPLEQRLSYDEALKIDQWLRDMFALRFCTAEEYLWAGSGPKNWRFPYGDARVPTRCAEDADGIFNNGYTVEIGGEDCPSWSGVRDLGTRNIWARLDADTRAQADAALARVNGDGGCVYPPREINALPAGMQLVVMGAVAGTDDAPGNMSGDLFGYHHHAHLGAFYDAPPADQGEWQDDQLWVCSDPRPFDPGRSSAWREVRAEFVARRSYAVLGD